MKETPDGYVGNLTPTEVGKYTVDVTYGSAVVPKSPFTVDVTPGVDLGKVTVTGLDTRKLACCLLALCGCQLIFMYRKYYWWKCFIVKKLLDDLD